MDLEAVLRSLGLNPAQVRGLVPVRRSETSRLYRLAAEGRLCVLKAFVEPDALEPKAYDLLRKLGVPTLPVLSSTPSALLLEDLEASRAWRLADERDVEGRDVGKAVAEWYQYLHVIGRTLVKKGAPGWLQWEWDILNPEAIVRAGAVLEMEENPVWEFAAQHLETLRSRARRLPMTLNYNDFYWTNLALSRQPPLKAIVFDYHLLGVGLAWSDVRNVTYSLGPAAREAFLDAYGPTRPEERVLDDALSVLHSLQVATSRPTVPRWAVPCVEMARSGSLLASLERAVDALGDS